MLLVVCDNCGNNEKKHNVFQSELMVPYREGGEYVDCLDMKVDLCIDCVKKFNNTICEKFPSLGKMIEKFQEDNND